MNAFGLYKRLYDEFDFINKSAQRYSREFKAGRGKVTALDDIMVTGFTRSVDRINFVVGLLTGAATLDTFRRDPAEPDDAVFGRLQAFGLLKPPTDDNPLGERTLTRWRQIVAGTTAAQMQNIFRAVRADAALDFAAAWADVQASIAALKAAVATELAAKPETTLRETVFGFTRKRGMTAAEYGLSPAIPAALDDIAAKVAVLFPAG